jgi:hypothetical protein
MADKLRHVIADFEWGRVDAVVDAFGGAVQKTIAA